MAAVWAAGPEPMTAREEGQQRRQTSSFVGGGCARHVLTTFECMLLTPSSVRCGVDFCNAAAAAAAMERPALDRSGSVRAKREANRLAAGLAVDVGLWSGCWLACLPGGSCGRSVGSVGSVGRREEDEAAWMMEWMGDGSRLALGVGWRGTRQAGRRATAGPAALCSGRGYGSWRCARPPHCAGQELAVPGLLRFVRASSPLVYVLCRLGGSAGRDASCTPERERENEVWGGKNKKK